MSLQTHADGVESSYGGFPQSKIERMRTFNMNTAKPSDTCFNHGSDKNCDKAADAKPRTQNNNCHRSRKLNTIPVEEKVYLSISVFCLAYAGWSVLTSHIDGLTYLTIGIVAGPSLVWGIASQLIRKEAQQ